MAFESNITPKILGLYDDELLVSHFEPGNIGKYIMRDSIASAHHSAGALNPHSTLANVVSCFNGQLFLSGNIRAEWEWKSGQISESEVDNYLTTISPALTNYTFTKDMANNKLYADITTDWQSSEWVDNHIRWQIASPKAKVILNSEDAEMLCVTRLNGSYSRYTFMNRTIESGETITLSRPEVESCFLLFSDSLNSGEKILRSKRMYKFVNATLNVTNNNARRVKIVRFTK